MFTTMTALLGLVCWTLIMWIWLYATRIPAMQKAGIDPGKLKQKGELDVLPLGVRQVADNYNHLHEQPVIFYALCVYSHVMGVDGALVVGAAWAYVVLRIVHSVFQATVNFVPARFGIFALASIALFVMAGANVLELFSA